MTHKVNLILVDECLYGLQLPMRSNLTATSQTITKGDYWKFSERLKIIEHLNYSASLYCIDVHEVKDTASAEIFQLYIFWMIT